MVCPLSKIKANIRKKRYSLYSFGMGSIFFLILYGLTKLFKTSLCPFFYLFNIPCFGCGLTRGFICVLEGKFAEASQFHILSIPLFVSIVLYFMIFVVDIILLKDNISKVNRFLTKKFTFTILVIIIIISYFINHIV